MINTTGLFIGLFTLLAIGFGFFWVIKLEYYIGAGSARVVFVLGLLLAVISLWISNFTLSACLGIVSGTVMWGAIELPHQEERVTKGLFAANPAKIAHQAASNVRDDPTANAEENKNL